MNTFEHSKWKFENCHKYGYSKEISDNFMKYDDSVYHDLDNECGNLRKASVIHKLVRKYAKGLLVDGAKYSDIVHSIENKIYELTKGTHEISHNIAFPIGLSVNCIAAHDTAMDNDIRVLQNGDVVKCDIGIHIEGDIIDSAFTHIVGETDETIKSHRLYPLLEASMDSVYTAISESGVDARLYEISGSIKETIESYEIDGKPIKAVIGLGGHLIDKYKLHGEKLILCAPHHTQKNHKMEEGEIYAIETYTSTGSGKLFQLAIDKTTHFGLNENVKNAKNANNDIVTKWAHTNRHGLPFTPRWTYDSGIQLNNVLDATKKNYLIAYPPLAESNTMAMTAQFEHTLKIKNGGVEIFSLGNDY